MPATITPQECEKTHPGFTITCQRCSSTRVLVDNTLGYSEESGPWGDVTLVCQDCLATCDLVDPA